MTTSSIEHGRATGKYLRIGFAFILLSVIPSPSVAAQATTGTPQPSAQPAALPVTSQVKKSIVFIETDCLHNFSVDAGSLTVERLEGMSAVQRSTIARQMESLTTKLQTLPPSLSKLDADEVASLRSNNADETVSDIARKLQILVKMTNLTPEDIAGLNPEQLSLLPKDSHLGTGFLVGLLDSRLNRPAGQTAPSYFTYLVTNRHVSEPGVEVGRPYRIVGTILIVNRRADAAHPAPYAEAIQLGRLVPWTFPEDESVDLAAVPIHLAENVYDYLVIPTTQFITNEDIQKHILVEGDPVLFSGLFIQSFSEVHTLEPIVRSGTLAMIPDGLLETTIQKRPGRIYLAEAHAFGGNSGSPMFVDTNKFANIISGPNYRFLGVISGEMLENSDLTMTVTTFVSGRIGANSGVSMVVPAAQVLKLLNAPSLQSGRDTFIRNQSSAPTTNQK